MYKKEKKSWMKHWDFILIDIVLLQVAFNIAYIIRHGYTWMYLNREYERLAMLMIIADICTAFFFESYGGILRRGYLVELKNTVQHVNIVFGILVVYLFLWKDSALFSRITVVMAWGIGIVLCYIGRVLRKNYLKKMVRYQATTRAVLVISTQEDAAKTIADLKQYEYAGIRPVAVAFVDEVPEETRIENVPVIGGEGAVIDYIKKNVVDEVYIDVEDRKKLKNSVDKYRVMGVTVHRKLLSQESLSGYQFVENFAGATVLTNTFKTATARQLFMKRILDICGGIVGVILTGMIFLFVAPVIYKQSPGPIFFSQTRIGRNGRKFKLYKFRSMYMDAEERKKELMAQNQMQGLMFKMDNDPRIFPFGHFLRNSSLDEFPQFWNVLKGDMSLVGTRPPTVDEFEQYQAHHRRRMAMKPGITGLWQVSGRSDITDFEEVVRLDTEYISDWRFSSDIKILFKTVQVVLEKKGSK